jgi:hypothetical protein
VHRGRGLPRKFEKVHNWAKPSPARQSKLKDTMYEYYGTRLNSNASSGAAEANGEFDHAFFPRMRHRLVVLV